MTSSIFGEKRTRSQLTIPDTLLYGISERSPLKDAKSALRRNGLLGATSPRDTEVEPSSEPDEDDELLLSPRRPATPPRTIKRSASPPPVDEDTLVTPSRKRDSKRQKLDVGKGFTTCEDERGKRSPLKHVRSLSVPESSTRSLIDQSGMMQNASNGLSILSELSPTKRARSVPAIPSSPFIDLRFPPKTPVRPLSSSKPEPPSINLGITTQKTELHQTDNDSPTSPMHVDGELPGIVVPPEQTPKKVNVIPAEEFLTPKPGSSTTYNIPPSSDIPTNQPSMSNKPPITPANRPLGAIFGDSPLTPVPETPFPGKKTTLGGQLSRFGSKVESRVKSSLSRMTSKDPSRDSSSSSDPSSSKQEPGSSSERTHEKSSMPPPTFIPSKKIVIPGTSSTSGDGPKKRNGFAAIMGNASKKPKLDQHVEDKARAPARKSTLEPPKATKSGLTVSGGIGRSQAIAISSTPSPMTANVKGKGKEQSSSGRPTLKARMKARTVIKPKAKPIPVPKPVLPDPMISEQHAPNMEETTLPTTGSETSTLVDFTEVASTNSPASREGLENAPSQTTDAAVDMENDLSKQSGEFPRQTHSPLSPTSPMPAEPVDGLPKAEPMEEVDVPREAMTTDLPPEPSEAPLEPVKPPLELEMTEDIVDSDKLITDSTAEETSVEASAPTPIDDDHVPEDTEVIPSSQEDAMDVTPMTPKAAEDELPSTDATITMAEAPAVATLQEHMVVDTAVEPVQPTIVESRSKSSIPRPKSSLKTVPSQPARVTRSASSKKAPKASASTESSAAITPNLAPKTPRKEKTSLGWTSIEDGAGEDLGVGMDPDTLYATSLSDVPSEPKSAPASPVKAGASFKKSGESSYARPTFSAISKQNPFGPASKPARSPNKLVRSASMHSTRPTALLHTLTGSSLSTLENALEKLQMPAPERPNTSLGFNRDNDDDDDDPKSETAEASTTRKGPFLASSRLSIKPHSTTGLVRPNAASGPSGATKPFGVKGMIMRGTGSQKSVGSSTKAGLAKFTVTGGPFAGASRARHAHRASKKTSLPVVIGSPVKGGGYAMDVDMDLTLDDLLPIATGSRASATSDNNPPSDSQPKEQSELDAKKHGSSGHSRRVSLISQALSQSLHDPFVNKPPVPFGNMGPPATPPGKGKARAQSEGVHTPSSDAGSVGSTSPVRRTSSRNLRSTNKPPEPKPPVQAAGSKKTQNVAAATEAKILKDCVVFVDVRTDEGEDAGSIFVEMLENVGARILTRVGQTCTHVIFKNGLMSTLNRYRLLRDPKPHVVGIAWVVECIEQKKKVDETKFVVDVEGMNVAGTNKRRRSVLPKFLTRDFDDENPSETDREHDGDGDTSLDRSTSSIIGDGLTPLERARMRKAA